MSEPTQEDVNKFLSILRASGLTNMNGAGQYIQKRFGVGRYEAHRFLIKWIKSFNKETDDA